MAKDITSWPPKERPQQVTREQLRKMTPEAIQQARDAGALDDLLGRPAPAPPAPPVSPVVQEILDSLPGGRQ